MFIHINPTVTDMLRGNFSTYTLIGGPRASILGGFEEQSLTFLKVGVDRLVISTNLLRLHCHNCVKSEVCFTISDMEG